MVLGSLKSLDDLRDGVQLSDLRSASLLSNEHLSISGAGNQLVGDLKYATTHSVSQLPNTARLEKVDPQDVPQIRIQDYDPAGKPEIVDFNRGGAPPAGQTLNVAGLARYQGNMTLNQGLVVDGGVLYVDGDLTITAGGIKGTGAVFCTGKLTIAGESSDLGADSMCALVAGGDLTLRGSSASSSQFRGLVYSSGDVRVSDITVVGAMVGAKPPGGRTPTMSVDRANLVYDARATDLDLDLQFSVQGGTRQRRMAEYSLAPGSRLSPQLDNGELTPPTRSQIAQALLFSINGRSFRYGDPLSDDDRQKADAAVDAAQGQIARQLAGQTVSESFHVKIDLNRFVDVRTSMRIMRREFLRL